MSAGVGAGLEFKVGLGKHRFLFSQSAVRCGPFSTFDFQLLSVYSHEVADCFTGWGCADCIKDGDPCVGDDTVPAGQCCHPKVARCENGGRYDNLNPDDCTCSRVDTCAATRIKMNVAHLIVILN